MIVVLKQNVSQEQIDDVVNRVNRLGLKGHVIQGTERVVIAAVGSEYESGLQESLESLHCVDRVMRILAPFKMASKEVQPTKTVVQSHSFEVGGTKIGVIAGPCSVESEEQIVETALAIKKAGATGLRGGAFKPRTSPYSFQGLKEEGLKMLQAAREASGLAVVTEVMAPRTVDLVCQYADVLQIGARNMQNYDLITEVGKQPKPVLLKRGPSASADEFLLAAEYILDQGNPNVILCERGIRTFESHTRFTLPLAIVPYLQNKTHLPIVVDPSHGTGKSSLVTPMSKAAVAVGADGLLVEVHPHPDEAWSDGAQTLDLPEFEDLMAQCARVAEAVDRTM